MRPNLMTTTTSALVLLVACGGGRDFGGTSFVGTRPTSLALRLTFFVHSASGTATFASDDGGCDVTVTAAETSAFDGTLSCIGVTDANGTVVIDAQSTFNASE